ncbi:MAG: histidine kinase dimerization/phospho-acceptor domain-containing protein [Pontibacterium sp.]
MRINYAQRLMLEVGNYTLILIFVLLSIIWLFSGSTRTDTRQEIAEHLQQAFSMTLTDTQPQGTVLSRTDFDLYLPPAPVPAPYLAISQPGYHLLDNGQSLLVDTHPVSGELYYVVFHNDEITDNTESEFDDILFVMSAIVLATGAAIMIVWLMAKRLASPILLLKQQVEEVTEGSKSLPTLDRDDEVGQLSQAFSVLIERMRDATHREQEFTRFASHELRSPVTVIRGNLDLLQESLPDSALNQRILSRMNAATQRISLLIEGFLWLGRENKDNIAAVTLRHAELQHLIDELLEAVSCTDKQRLQVSISELEWQAKPLMLSILMDNLIRNALQHSSQPICITASHASLEVQNPIDEAEKDQARAEQQGFGLQIVKRICEANQWQCDIQSDNSRFSVCIRLKP